MAVMRGAFAHEVARALMFLELLKLKIRNAEVVITRYVMRARRVREGENWMMINIQPRCAMEEYARILRSCVWFRPPHPPISVEAIPIKIRRS